MEVMFLPPFVCFSGCEQDTQKLSMGFREIMDNDGPWDNKHSIGFWDDLNPNQVIFSLPDRSLIHAILYYLQFPGFYALLCTNDC